MTKEEQEARRIGFLTELKALLEKYDVELCPDEDDHGYILEVSDVDYTHILNRFRGDVSARDIII